MYKTVNGKVISTTTFIQEELLTYSRIAEKSLEVFDILVWYIQIEMHIQNLNLIEWQNTTTDKDAVGIYK